MVGRKYKSCEVAAMNQGNAHTNTIYETAEPTGRRNNGRIIRICSVSDPLTAHGIPETQTAECRCVNVS